MKKRLAVWEKNLTYLGIRQIQKDQVTDLAKRKNVPVEEVEKWLKMSLGYEV